MCLTSSNFHRCQKKDISKRKKENAYKAKGTTIILYLDVTQQFNAQCFTLNVQVDLLEHCDIAHLFSPFLFSQRKLPCSYNTPKGLRDKKIYIQPQRHKASRLYYAQLHTFTYKCFSRVLLLGYRNSLRSKSQAKKVGRRKVCLDRSETFLPEKKRKE